MAKGQRGANLSCIDHHQLLLLIFPFITIIMTSPYQRLCRMSIINFDMKHTFYLVFLAFSMLAVTDLNWEGYLPKV